MPESAAKPSAPDAPRWDFLNVNHIVERGGANPRADAVVIEGNRSSYADLRRAARRVANSLLDSALQPRQRVAITAKNCLEYFEVEFGVSAAAGIFVPMSWRLAASERERLLERSRSHVLVADPEFVGPLAAARADGRLPDLKLIVSLGDCAEADISYEAWCRDASDSPPDVPAPIMSDAHEIIYTSGTTGDPKGVVWSHGTVLWNNTQQIVDFGIRPGDSNYVALDLNYIGGRHDFTMAMLQQGGTVHLRPSGGFEAGQILRYLAEHRISHVLWVPTMLHDVLNEQELLAELDLSGLRMIMCGGSPLSREIILRAQAAFPHSDFVQVFGLTEGGGTPTFVPKERLLEKVGSAGLPSMFNEIRIVDADGLACPAEQVGEIQVRGPAVTPGYWENPEANDRLVENGWLHTGDLGRCDDEGFLYVAGRVRDLIISGGMNIFPADVEHVIAEHAAVDMVSVIGLPHERWGETVCAVVRLRHGQDVSEGELIEHCRERLASYKKPTRVVFVSDFPMTVSGKIRKTELVRLMSTDPGEARL